MYNSVAKMRRSNFSAPRRRSRLNPFPPSTPDRGRHTSAFTKIVGMVILGSGLYTAFLCSREWLFETPEKKVGVSSGSGPPKIGKPRPRPPQNYRKLNMLGMEAAGENGKWKTCRTYKETDLQPHKKDGQSGFDKELKPVQPAPGVSWELQISESLDEQWLGLHQWDDRYKHGSEEADRRVERLGYCRIHMPSVPRTGSTWFRAMFETVTGQPTFSMWAEGGSKKEKYKAFSSDDPCGTSLDKMEGMLHSKRVFPCRDLRPPNDTSPILYKSHTPFFPSYNKPGLMPEDTCMLVLLVRNPVDNQDAWMRYMAGKGQILRDYLPVWQAHIAHWIAEAVDIPIYVFRYEDILYRAEVVMRNVMEVLPGGWRWSDESIEKAMRTYGPKKPFKEKCGSAIGRASLAEMEMVRRHYSGILGHLGYRFVRVPNT